MLHNSAGSRLRDLIESEGWVLAPGVPDSFAARLAVHAGAQAVYISGLVSEAIMLGAPDVGLMTLSEITTHAKRIVDASGVPVICDADVAFVGGPVNVARTVHEFECAGVAAIHIEDQALPKKCPVIPGKVVLPRGQAIARIDAAVRARSSDGIAIIARTDADYVSIDEIIARCRAFLDVGADFAMPVITEVEGETFGSLTPEHQFDVLSRIAAEVDGPLTLMGSEPPAGFHPKDLGALGYRILPIATAAFEAAGTAMLRVYRELLSSGNSRAYFDAIPSQLPITLETMGMFDLPAYLAIEERFERVAASHA